MAVPAALPSISIVAPLGIVVNVTSAVLAPPVRRDHATMPTTAIIAAIATSAPRGGEIGGAPHARDRQPRAPGARSRSGSSPAARRHEEAELFELRLGASSSNMHMASVAMPGTTLK